MNNTAEIAKQLKNRGYILVGSRAFFTGMKNFQPHDYDFLKIVNKGKGFDYHSHSHVNGICRIEIVEMPFKKFYDYAIEKSNYTMALAMVGFLVPEVARKFDFDFIRDHKYIEPFLNKLGKKHQYYKYIYNAYLENGEMRMTDEQREIAYKSYTISRR